MKLSRLLAVIAAMTLLSHSVAFGQGSPIEVNKALVKKAMSSLKSRSLSNCEISLGWTTKSSRTTENLRAEILNPKGTINRIDLNGYEVVSQSADRKRAVLIHPLKGSTKWIDRVTGDILNGPDPEGRGVKFVELDQLEIILARSVDKFGQLNLSFEEDRTFLKELQALSDKVYLDANFATQEILGIFPNPYLVLQNGVDQFLTQGGSSLFTLGFVIKDVRNLSVDDVVQILELFAPDDWDWSSVRMPDQPKPLTL